MMARLVSEFGPICKAGCDGTNPGDRRSFRVHKIGLYVIGNDFQGNDALSIRPRRISEAFNRLTGRRSRSWEQVMSLQIFL